LKPKLFGFVGGLIVGGIFAGVLGLLIGSEFGAVNRNFDFCIDDGTTRYILDEESRKRSCGFD
jgi:hypothetical protein